MSNAAGATLNIDNFASANATAGNATAYAYQYYGIQQYASATSGGDASNSITNDGTLTIDNSAVAHGTSYAYAYASQSYAISQTAYATEGGKTERRKDVWQGHLRRNHYSDEGPVEASHRDR